MFNSTDMLTSFFPLDYGCVLFLILITLGAKIGSLIYIIVDWYPFTMAYANYFNNDNYVFLVYFVYVWTLPVVAFSGQDQERDP